MKLADSSQMRELDRITMEDYKTPGILLMENAGMRVADEVDSRFEGNVLVVCGKGNNGGDGSIAARHLYARGRDVALTFIGGTDSLKGDAETAYHTAVNLGMPVLDWCNDLPHKYDVIIDAIFGIGISGAPKGEYETAIKAINNAGKKVVAVDIPSGGNADNGHVAGECVKADVTVTFGMGKVGLVCYPLKHYAGEVVVKPISFAPVNMDTKVSTLDNIEIPHVPDYAHKGSQGKVLVISGSRGLTGAATLNCNASLHSGCGMVTLGIPESLNPIMEEKLTETMTIPLPEKDGHLSDAAARVVVEMLDKYDAVLCGSGLSQKDGVEEVVYALINHAKKTLVLDADALNIISKEINVLKNKKCNLVVTPHIGEMARLMGVTIAEVEQDTVKAARDFAVQYGVVTVLKSAHTVIASPDGEVFINTLGNGGMATAGSGDVLAGVIVSFAAQGFDALTAAKYGVYSHAAAGDRAAAKYGERYITATEIIENLKG